MNPKRNRLNKLRKILSVEHFMDFKDNVKRVYEQNYSRFAMEHMTRFDKLIQPYAASLNIDIDRWIVNLSDIELPWNVKSILALGNKFNLPTENMKVNADQFIANLEPKLQKAGKDVPY